MKEFEMLKKEKNKKIERELSKSLQIKQSIEREININEKNLNNKNKRRRDK
jgi:Fe-S cluster biosynthesis and repair protein YggX